MNKAFASTPVRAAVLLLVLAMGGCSSVDSSNDKVDYKAGARKTAPLDVPPDLTALARDGRYTPQAGSVSANALQQPKGPAASDGSKVAPVKSGDVRLERQGDARWLVTPQTAEVVYPKIKQFWADMGLALVTDSPETGVLETDWAENRAKLPQDLIRATIGKVFDNLYSTGQRDKYRTRIERSERGTEITVVHRGVEEVLVGKDRDGSTTWTNRPSDPLMEAEMLSRLMLALGGSEAAAKAVVAGPGPASGPTAAAPATAAKARLLTAQAGSGAGLVVDDTTERAWRRVGLALDRSGFTVEDRDRAQMLYFVRYADPKAAGQEEPGFFARLFSSKEAIAQLSRYRIAVKASGNQTVVNVLTADGAPDSSTNAQRIATRLVEELKN